MKPVSKKTKFINLYSQRTDGNIDARFSSKKEVAKNLKKFCQKHKLDPENLVQMEQVHSTKIAVLTKRKCAGKILPKVDGLITNQKNLLLMLRTADCVPVSLFDSRQQVISLVHAGWRGTIAKICLKAILLMTNHFSTKLNDLKVILGPSIQSCCFKTATPPLQTQLPEWEPFIKKRQNLYHLDLPGFVKRDLLDIGLQSTQINLSNQCTYHHSDNWFSYQRSLESGEPEGRFATILGLS